MNLCTASMHYTRGERSSAAESTGQGTNHEVPHPPCPLGENAAEARARSRPGRAAGGEGHAHRPPGPGGGMVLVAFRSSLLGEFHFQGAAVVARPEIADLE